MNRSTDPEDYQYVARPVSVLAKNYPQNFVIAEHKHERDQLVYAKSGAMRVKVKDETWVVPPTRAVYVPAGIDHSIKMFSDVEMRTLYIKTNCYAGLPTGTIVVEVTELLKILILNLLREEIEYDEQGRGGDIVRLILSELLNAKTCEYYSVPALNDARIKPVCEGLISDPSRSETLEEWAHLINTSARTLTRVFLKETGLSFSEWRQRVRLQKAMAALTCDEPIKLVAHQNGYSSVSAFTYSFRRFYGFTPGSVCARK